MMTAKGVRTVVAAAGLALLASCTTPPPPPPPAIVQAPPPAAPAPKAPPPPMALATRVIEDASAFRAYMSATAAISPDFRSADQVAQGVRTASAFEQNQLQQGAIAFVAVTALQEPSFVAAVREFAADPDQRQAIVRTLMSDPSYAASFPNADKAAGLAISALDGMGARVLSAGKAVKQAAYDVQRQPWSKAYVKNPEGRLNDTKVRSSQRILASLTDIEEMRKASLEGAAMSLAGAPVAPPYTPVVARGMAIAVLAALGEAGDDRMSMVLPLLQDESSAYCLNMSKLNLYQCLAVSKPHYEDIFCLGQHSMIDIGQCVSKAAGAPAQVFLTPAPATPPSSALTRTSAAESVMRQQ